MNLSVGTMNEFFSLRDVDKAENFFYVIATVSFYIEHPCRWYDDACVYEQVHLVKART